MDTKDKNKYVNDLIDRGIVKFEESKYICSDGSFWYASKLARLAKEQGCKKYKLHLADMDFSNNWGHFDGQRIIDMAVHAKRALDTNLSHPIIISPVGGLLDGTHRLMKALIEGRKWVWAIRLKHMPEPDGKE